MESPERLLNKAAQAWIEVEFILNAPSSMRLAASVWYFGKVLEL